MRRTALIMRADVYKRQVQAIPALLEQLPAIITSISDTLVANMPMILETGVQLLIQLASGIIQAIPQLVAQLPQIISAIVSGIGALMSSCLFYTSRRV